MSVEIRVSPRVWTIERENCTFFLSFFPSFSNEDERDKETGGFFARRAGEQRSEEARCRWRNKGHERDPWHRNVSMMLSNAEAISHMAYIAAVFQAALATCTPVRPSSFSSSSSAGSILLRRNWIEGIHRSVIQIRLILASFYDLTLYSDNLSNNQP